MTEWVSKTKLVTVIKLLHSQQIAVLVFFSSSFSFFLWGCEAGREFISYLGCFLLFLLCSTTLLQEVHTLLRSVQSSV